MKALREIASLQQAASRSRAAIPADPPRTMFGEAILLDPVPDPHPGDVDVQGPLAPRTLELPGASRRVTGPVFGAVRVRDSAGAVAGPDQHVACRIQDDHAAVNH